jgi:hypothetical protein
MELESKVAAKSTEIWDLNKRIQNLKAQNAYFKTTSQATTSINQAGNPVNQNNTTQDLTDTAKDMERKLSELHQQRADLVASGANTTEYKRTFRMNHIVNSVTVSSAEYTRISWEITWKVNSSYNLAYWVATGNPNKFRENERGININKFLKILAESMKK